MAYVLGYLYADGSMEDASYLRGKYIRVTSVEKYSIERIKKWLESGHTIVPNRPTSPNGKTRFTLRIGNHRLYYSLLKFGLHPNKSLTIKFPAIPQEYLADFVRGYFDGDGCVNLWRSKSVISGLIILRKLSVIFTSGSRFFLEELNKNLKLILNLKQSRVYGGHRSFQLRYGTADSIEMFKFLYSNAEPETYFERKFDIFKKYFALRPQRIDKKICLILKSNGHVVK